jgi:hypothetical protein
MLPRDGKAFAFQKLAQQTAQLGVVVNQQDPHGSNVARLNPSLRNGCVADGKGS